MATAPASDVTITVPNFSEPQPTVTIYIPAQKESGDKDIVARMSSLGQASISGSNPTQTTPDPESPKFLIHKHLICYYSPFFSAAFNSNFKEGLSQEMTLDVNLKAFGLFVNWLYNQVIVGASGEQPSLSTVAHLWILAERFLLPKLQNQAMDKMYSILVTGATPVREFASFCNIAEHHGDGDNRLIDLAAAVLTWQKPGDTFNIDPDLVPHLVYAKSWASLKVVQPTGTGLPPAPAEFHVKEDAE